MLYLLAIIFPPLAVLLAGRPIQALLNLGLTLLIWIPGVIHAILVINEKKADKRMVKQVKLQNKLTKEQQKDFRESQRMMAQDDLEKY